MKGIEKAGSPSRTRTSDPMINNSFAVGKQRKKANNKDNIINMIK